MLAKKYEEKFLSADPKNKSLIPVIERVIEAEEKFNIPCTNWELEHVEEYLRSQNSISVGTLSRAYTFLKNFVKFICQEENIEEPNFKLKSKLDEFIDYDKLMNTVLSYQQYQYILEQIPSARIRTIVRLAWIPLTSDEIKNLKVRDIEFIDGDFGLNAILKLNDRTLTIEDPEVAKDIEKCINETKYFIITKNGAEKEMRLKDSVYLIKPVVAGQAKEDISDENAQVTNPSITLQKALRQLEVKCQGIDIDKLSVEYIKRAKVVYMLNNKEFYTKEDVSTLLGGGDKTSYLCFLEKVADKKYNQ